jgi:hypothetical protein
MSINEFTNQELITIVNSSMGMIPAPLFNLAATELTKRLNNSSHAEAVRDEEQKAFKESVYQQIKDLHERYDQICKKLVKFEKAPVSDSNKVIEEKFFDVEHSKYSNDCKVTVPNGWHIYKRGSEINWSDEDMLNIINHSLIRPQMEPKEVLLLYKGFLK